MTMHPSEDEVYGTDLVPLADVIEQQLAELSSGQQEMHRGFVGFGFDEAQALRLVRAHAPIYRIERALMAGCSIQLALDIWT